MNLEYWVEYVAEFGISHKIPPYDKMGVIKHYNLDLIAIFLVVAIVIIYIALKIVVCCCCNSKKKVKQE